MILESSAEENLLDITNHFFTPDIVKKVSTLVGHTQEKTLMALKSIVPTFISEIINIGSIPEGAENIVGLVRTHHFDKDIVPDEKNLNEGEEIIQDLFGKKLEPTITTLSSKTKLDRISLEKIMKIVAPTCMGIIGKKISSENMNMAGVMTYISNQKKYLTGYSSDTSEYYKLSGRNPQIDKAKQFDKPIWKSWVLAMVIGAGTMIWWNAIQYRSPATIPTPVSAVTSAPIAVLDDYLENPVLAELPKSFYFDEIVFLGESTRLAGGFNEIGYVAGVLKKYPNVSVKLVSYSENIGSDKQTLDFATRRAELVRNEVVARGVRPDQVIAVGMPIARRAGSITTTPANSAYQKFELVVTRIK